jgi:LuxR family maltose regulon positive regulatory protein
MYAAYARSQAQRALGRLSAAYRTCKDVIERFGSAEPGTAFPVLGIAQTGLAEVLLERGELDAALRLARSGSELCTQLGYARWHVSGLTILARVFQARGQTAEALAAFDEAGPVLTDAEAVTDVLNPAAAERARIHLVQNDVATVQHWVDERELDEHAAPAFAREQEYLILVRLLVAQGEPQRALSVARCWRSLAEQQQRSGSALEWRVLEAVSLAATGNLRDASSTLSEALIAGANEGVIRVFVDGGARLKSLLETISTSRVSRMYVDRVLAAFQPPPPEGPVRAARPAGAPQSLVEPLSVRELEVLRLLAAGLSNRQIADELVVALDTVKKHVSHIFGKLGATSRTQAVARARELALL